jgi:hypothetical protein
MTNQKPAIALAALCAVLAAAPVRADLQHIEVGGSIEIYGVYYSEYFAPRGDVVVWPPFWLRGRAIGPNGTATEVRPDGRGHSLDFFEQRVKLNVRAEFSRDVAAFIEFDSVWESGEGFRSNYLTGQDSRRGAGDNFVSLYQAYVEAEQFLDLPLRLRAGRQELAFGDEWLVGVNNDPDMFAAHTFDALRLTLSGETYSIDAWAALLEESGVAEQDGDVWFYGLYGSYHGLQDMEFDAYYMFLRDPRRVADTNFPWFAEAIENILGLDDYDPTTLHTAGMRWAGAAGGFDWTAEAAYQWGRAGQLGSGFQLYDLYGDSRARYDHWAGVAEMGYTFGQRYTPRVYVGGGYYGADDRRGISFWDWLNPFDRPKASTAFNRLFSGQRHTHFLDATGLSNFWFVRGGVQAAMTESLDLELDILYHEVLEPFELPVHFRVGRYRIPIAPALPFWTRTGADELGFEVTLRAVYAYSDDVELEVAYVRGILGDAYRDGVFFDDYAQTFVGGSGKRDADSLYFLLSIGF